MNKLKAGGNARESRMRKSRGFTLIEVVIVVAIAMVMMAAAVPVVQASMRFFQLRSGISAVTGAIQSTRYQAIFQGCPYQIVFTKATRSYQVSSTAPLGGAAAGTGCTAAYVAVGGAIPIFGNTLNLGADTTMQFHPGGSVTPAGGIAMTVGNATQTATITVSNYGNINVTMP